MLGLGLFQDGHIGVGVFPDLRDGLSLATLQRIAAVRSDTEAAQQMQQAKRRLFEQFRPAPLGRWK